MDRRKVGLHLAKQRPDRNRYDSLRDRQDLRISRLQITHTMHKGAQL
jgi:hypothetical protein